jgi:hypothetical protein
MPTLLTLLRQIEDIAHRTRVELHHRAGLEAERLLVRGFAA